MIRALPYLSFKNAKEAMEYYEKALGISNVKRTKATPELAKKTQVNISDFENSTIDGSFEILGQKVLVTDEFDFPKQNSIIIMFETKDVAEIKAFYDKIKAQGLVNITYEIQDDPFGALTFMFEDKYKILWMFTEILDDKRST